VVGDFVLQMAFRRGILSGGDFVQGDFVRFPLGLHWILKNEKHVINSSILRDGSLWTHFTALALMEALNG